MKPLGLIYLATKNITRRRFRTVVTSLAMIAIIGTLFTTQVFVQGVAHAVEVGTERLGADMIIVPIGSGRSAESYLLTGQASSFYMNDSVLQEVRALPEVEKASPQIFLTTLKYAPCCFTGNLQIVGIDPSTDFTITPWLITPLREPLNSSEGIIGNRVYYVFGQIQPYFFGRTFTIVGQLERMELGIDDSFFISIDAARQIIQANNEGLLPRKLPMNVGVNQISDVVAKLKPGTNLLMAANHVKNSIRGVDVITTSDMTRAVQNQLAGLIQSIYITAASSWMITVVMVAVIFSMSVNERGREIGLLRTLGSTRRFVLALITLEGTLLTLLGGILGIIIGCIAVFDFASSASNAIQLTFDWPSIPQIAMLIVESIAIATAIGLLASAYPAYKSSRMEPYAAIRQE
jgi:putative ABC transport system permease protein